MSETVYYYDAEKNPTGVFYPGIPLADLTEGDVAHLSKEQRAHLEKNPMYRKTPLKDAPTDTQAHVDEAAPAKKGKE